MKGLTFEASDLVNGYLFIVHTNQAFARQYRLLSTVTQVDNISWWNQLPFCSTEAAKIATVFNYVHKSLKVILYFSYGTKTCSFLALTALRNSSLEWSLSSFFHCSSPGSDKQNFKKPNLHVQLFKILSPIITGANYSLYTVGVYKPLKFKFFSSFRNASIPQHTFDGLKHVVSIVNFEIVLQTEKECFYRDRRFEGAWYGRLRNKHSVARLWTLSLQKKKGVK